MGGDFDGDISGFVENGVNEESFFVAMEGRYGKDGVSEHTRFFVGNFGLIDFEADVVVGFVYVVIINVPPILRSFGFFGKKAFFDRVGSFGFFDIYSVRKRYEAFL